LKAFVADIAVKTGKGRSTVARDATRAKKVAVLDDIAGTCLDKGDEIDALGKLLEGDATTPWRSSPAFAPRQSRSAPFEAARNCGHQTIRAEVYVSLSDDEAEPRNFIVSQSPWRWRTPRCNR
jgi:hypothetical protein